MKVIFLDNDGVICLSNNWGSRHKKAAKYFKRNPEAEFAERPVEVRLDNFDKKAISVLNKILEETEAEIVVSSDWKKHATLEDLGNYYISQGIIKKPIATTPDLDVFDWLTYELFSGKGWSERKRILEIKEYLRLNPNVDKWVAVDDLDMSNEYNGGYGLDNFVLVSRSSEGIKQMGIKEKIINFLNR